MIIVWKIFGSCLVKVNIGMVESYLCILKKCRWINRMNRGKSRSLIYNLLMVRLLVLFDVRCFSEGMCYMNVEICVDDWFFVIMRDYLL